MMSPRKHSYWMSRALVEARKGLGFVHPNPMVGAIVLNDVGYVIGRGYHKKYGFDHAEVMALKKALPYCEGGTMYVTLEPCNHHGKTPPCADAIIASGIKKVFVGCVDPNPKVAGSGIQKLRDAGIEVEVGLLEDRAKNLNVAFNHCIEKKTPFVRAKVAMTIDGIIGHKEKRIQLSGAQLQNITMRLRAESQAIITGVNTIIIDNPRLNVRGRYSDRRPVRVILDSFLRTPTSANIFGEEGEILILCDSSKVGSDEWKHLETRAELIPTKSVNEKIDPTQVLKILEDKGITSIFIESGANVLESFRELRLINQWIIYLNSNNLTSKYSAEKLVKVDPNPLFSLEFQSVIRRGDDLVVTSTSRSLI